MTRARKRMKQWRSACQKSVLGQGGPQQVAKMVRGSIPPFRPCTRPGEWRRRAEQLRRQALSKVYLRGWPEGILETPPRVVWGEELRPHPAYVVRKLRYEAAPDYWIPALLYEPTGLAGRAPAVLNPNGHHSGGKACGYKQARCINLAKRGMLALNCEFLGMCELEGEAPHCDFALLDHAGRAGVGLFYLAMSKSLDVLLAHPKADPARVCMTGLSGGGWQTIILSALDPRITVSVPVAGYTGMRARVGCMADVGDLEQAPVDLTTVFDYQDMTAMVAPRPMLQILNEQDDCCFQTARAKPVIHDAVRPVWEAFGAGEAFECHNNQDPGTHNYGADNRAQLYQFLNRHFGLDSPETDLPFEDEIYPEAELRVGLPPERKAMRGIALERARRLVAGLALPCTAASRRRLRKTLAKVLRLPRYPLRLPPGPKRAGTWLLPAGPLKLPVSGVVRAKARRARLVIADGGRASCREFEPLPGESLFAADILGSGENAVDGGLLMMLDCAGRRTLGVRVAQVLACSDFAAAKADIERIEITAVGMNSGIAAVLAAALRPERFCAVTANELPDSYLAIYERGLDHLLWQQSFCFGLLEVADILHIVSLMDGVELRRPGRCLPPHRPPGGKR